MKKKLAFTLCEVLIALGIVGIVAENTIPTLVNDFQKQVQVTQLKGSYSNLQQFFKQYLADQGRMELDSTPLYDGTTWLSDAKQSQVDSIIRQYFKVAKACKAYPSSPRDTSCDISERWLGGAGPSTMGSGGTYNFCTVDGACFFMSIQTPCTPNYTKIGNMLANCGYVRIDTNGANSPNQFGRDAWYNFIIGHDGTVYPRYGVEYAKFVSGVNWATSGAYWNGSAAPVYCGTLGSSDLPSNVQGTDCAARVMEEGWVMNY